MFIVIQRQNAAQRLPYHYISNFDHSGSITYGRFWDVTRVRYVIKPLPSAQRVTCSSRNRQACKTLMQSGGRSTHLHTRLTAIQIIQPSKTFKTIWDQRSLMCVFGVCDPCEKQCICFCHLIKQCLSLCGSRGGGRTLALRQNCEAFSSGPKVQ